MTMGCASATTTLLKTLHATEMEAPTIDAFAAVSKQHQRLARLLDQPLDQRDVQPRGHPLQQVKTITAEMVTPVAAISQRTMDQALKIRIGTSMMTRLYHGAGISAL